MALRPNSSPAFLSANQGPIDRLRSRGVEWRRQHGDKPVPMKTLRAWSLPTRKATSSERRQWLEAITADPNVGNGRIQSTSKSIAWCPPLTAPADSTRLNAWERLFQQFEANLRVRP